MLLSYRKVTNSESEMLCRIDYSTFTSIYIYIYIFILKIYQLLKILFWYLCYFNRYKAKRYKAKGNLNVEWKVQDL